MQRLSTGEPEWDLVFATDGGLDQAARQALLDGVTTEKVTDLVLFSHGWSTSEKDARDHCAQLFPMIRDAMVARPGFGAVGFVGIYWPSLWFPDTTATAPQAGGSTQAETGAVVDASAGTAALSGAAIAASLAEGFPDADDRQTVEEIGKLIDDGLAGASTATDEDKQQQLRAIRDRIRSMVPPAPEDGQVEDQGETALLLAHDPKAAYLATAAQFGSVAPGSSTQGLGDWFSTALNGAKDALRVLSYNTMKARAGTIGTTGLGPLLADLHRGSPSLRVHLVGHSFGARLVSFALSGVGAPDQSPVASLTLVQGAFSHWSFAHAQDNPFGEAGALNTFVDRVHGPLVATYTVFDWALGRWYPKASFLAQQSSESSVAGRWDAIGADGFLAVTPAVDTTADAFGSTDHAFTAGTFCRVNAAAIINNTDGQAFAGAHSDIYKPAIGRLVAAAAAAHA
jgi:hypothetical protein